MGRGRPSKLTPEFQDTIVPLIEEGAPAEVAAEAAGIDRATFYRWMRRGREERARVEASSRARIRKRERPYCDFCDAVTRARAMSEAKMVETIAKSAPRDWRAAAWLLEHRYPAKYGKQVRVESLDLSELSDAQLAAIASGEDDDMPEWERRLRALQQGAAAADAAPDS